MAGCGLITFLPTEHTRLREYGYGGQAEKHGKFNVRPVRRPVFSEGGHDAKFQVSSFEFQSRNLAI